MRSMLAIPLALLISAYATTQGAQEAAVRTPATATASAAAPSPTKKPRWRNLGHIILKQPDIIRRPTSTGTAKASIPKPVQSKWWMNPNPCSHGPECKREDGRCLTCGARPYTGPKTWTWEERSIAAKVWDAVKRLLTGSAPEFSLPPPCPDKFAWFTGEYDKHFPWCTCTSPRPHIFPFPAGWRRGTWK